MNRNTDNIYGLTKVILEALIELTPEVMEAGEQWSEDMLKTIEVKVHKRLSPQGSKRERMLFDFLFTRSFEQAKDAFFELTAVSAMERQSYQSSIRQATA